MPFDKVYAFIRLGACLTIPFLVSYTNIVNGEKPKAFPRFIFEKQFILQSQM